jgi:hypothetical protein
MSTQHDSIEKFDLDDEDDDFGFIISSEGELKSMMIPEELMDDPPPEIEKILNIFGIKNIHILDGRTLH